MKRRWLFVGSMLVTAAAVGGFYVWTQWPIWRVERVVADAMIDPTSVLFRGVTVVDGIACGQVNSKNRMGAYVGFTDFAIDVSGALLISPTDSFDGSTVGKSVSQMKTMLKEAEGRLALLTRIEALCLATKGVPPTLRRTDFEVRNFEEPDPDLVPALERSVASCASRYMFRHKTNPKSILIQCKDASGKEAHWIWTRGDKTAAGPIFNLRT